MPQFSTDVFEAYIEINNSLYNRLKNKSLERFISRNLSPFRNKAVLDVGAGGGIWTKFWLERGAKVTALELRGPILQANKIWNPQAEFVEGNACTVKIDKNFDIIFAKDVIEHLTDDKSFLQNMADHLRKDGILIITTQNSISLNYFIEGGYYFLFGNQWCGWDPTHLRFYNFRNLSKKMNDTGFEISKWWSTYHFPYRFLSVRIIKRYIEWKGFQIIELMNLNDKILFNLTGWCIGVIAIKK